MDNSIQIVKTVINTDKFTKVVDTSFKTFTQPVPEEDPDTPEELFRLYEKLYFSIDITGETNSHEYLIKKSSELVNYDAVTEDIQPLLDEIAQLREQNLALNQQLIDLEAEGT
jgi:hypothetical protein